MIRQVKASTDSTLIIHGCDHLDRVPQIAYLHKGHKNAYAIAHTSFWQKMASAV